MTTARMRPFERSLPMQLMLAREAVMQRFRPHLNAHGLTDQQWRIVRALNEVAELEIVALGERCCLHAASLSRILPKLEDSGLIARRASRDDQRRVIVSLTAKGRRLFAAVAPQSEAVYAALARDIGPVRLERIYRLLDEMLVSLAQPRKGRQKTQHAAAALQRPSVRRARRPRT
jgi:homoprotocatechuate degradation regulator HpaR